MGHAAYIRGNKLISRQLQAGRRPVEFEVMDRLNALPKYPKAPTPFGPCNLVSDHHGWWVECPTTGFGYCYKTLEDAVKNWNISVTEYDGTKWTAIPNTGGQ